MKALIITGPRDGELTDHDRPVLELIDPGPKKEIPNYKNEPELAELEELQILTYKRITFYDGEKYVKLYVPNEWTHRNLPGKILGYFLRKAFKDAAK